MAGPICSASSLNFAASPPLQLPVLRPSSGMTWPTIFFFPFLSFLQLKTLQKSCVFPSLGVVQEVQTKRRCEDWVVMGSLQFSGFRGFYEIWRLIFLAFWCLELFFSVIESVGQSSGTTCTKWGWKGIWSWQQQQPLLHSATHKVPISMGRGFRVCRASEKGTLQVPNWLFLESEEDPWVNSVLMRELRVGPFWEPFCCSAHEAYVSCLGFSSCLLAERVTEARKYQLQATELLAELIKSDNPQTTAQTHVDSLTEDFFLVASTYLEMVHIFCISWVCLLIYLPFSMTLECEEAIENSNTLHKPSCQSWFDFTFEQQL